MKCNVSEFQVIPSLFIQHNAKCESLYIDYPYAKFASGAPVQYCRLTMIVNVPTLDEQVWVGATLSDTDNRGSWAEVTSQCSNRHT